MPDTVVKRRGCKQPMQFGKIASRVEALCYDLDASVIKPVLLAEKVASGLYDAVTTADVDVLIAETAASMTADHTDYPILAARVAVSSLHKMTAASFSQTIDKLHNYISLETGQQASQLADDVHQIVMENAERLDAEIVYVRDLDLDFFGFKTFERSYLLRVSESVIERPQHMFMRVAVGLHRSDIDAACKTYHLLSEHWYTHASLVLFNAGTPRPQLCSCFLVAMKDDSIEGIYDTLKECACISKPSGGIDLHAHNVRAAGSYVHGTASGLVPMLRLCNASVRSIAQGGGGRRASHAIYLEPWHADIFAFLELRKNRGVAEARAQDLFCGLWVCDLFMAREEGDAAWTLFWPSSAPGLADVWGSKFEELYTRYEREGRGRRTQCQLGGCGVRSWRRRWRPGRRTCCTRTPATASPTSSTWGPSRAVICVPRSWSTYVYLAPDETAVCNLASVELPRFVRGLAPVKQAKRLCGSLDHKGRTFDFDKLAAVVKVVIRNLDRVIDINHYPMATARRSNMRHRPIGLRVQGLADTFILLRLPFDSAEAKFLNNYDAISGYQRLAMLSVLGAFLNWWWSVVQSVMILVDSHSTRIITKARSPEVGGD
eukprot:jgi/Ulvmu1/3512/UM162_0019.1